MSKRFLLAAGLIIALATASVAFGAVVTNVDFHGSFPKDSNASIAFPVKRLDGRTTKIRRLNVSKFNMNCAKSGHIQYTSDWVTIDTRVKHRHWHYNGVQFDFQGTFRKHNDNKADGTLEETLKGINLGRGAETCDGGPRVFHAHAVPIN